MIIRTSFKINDIMNRIICEIYDIMDTQGCDSMPSARIHEAIVKELNVDKRFDDLLLRIGTVSPDCWRNVEPESGVKDKYLTHFWDFRIKDGQANDYQEFYLKYYNKLNNPFYFGYLVHLIVDQYWKTYIDPKYETTQNGVKGFKLKNGSFHDNENWWGYFDSLKMQKQIAKIYKLGAFPINKEDLINFECNIDELNLNGLFGLNGTLNYINTEVMPGEVIEESEIYDINQIVSQIRETAEFVKKELKRLEAIKIENDNKIKIAVDIDDTLLCTKELEEFYWQEFLKSNPEIDPNKQYAWGDPELALFWKLYREKMAFGKVKPCAQKSLQQLLDNNYQVDLLSARPLDKYASLKKKLVEYFELNGIQYNYMNLGFHSKKEFLEEHKYDILIDNDLRYIKEAESVGVIPILFGKDESYEGYQTDNWDEIPSLINEIISKQRIKQK